jgi:hypothetical protein
MALRHDLNETHTLLRAYAAARYVLTVAGTIAQLCSWYEGHAGVRISERTFKLHTRQLRDAGLIHVHHSKRFTSYTLLSEEIEVPRVKFLPTLDPEVFDIAEDGTETVRALGADVEGGWFNRNCEPARKSDLCFAGTLPF